MNYSKGLTVDESQNNIHGVKVMDAKGKTFSQLSCFFLMNNTNISHFKPASLLFSW